MQLLNNNELIYTWWSITLHATFYYFYLPFLESIWMLDFEFYSSYSLCPTFVHASDKCRFSVCVLTLTFSLEFHLHVYFARYTASLYTWINFLLFILSSQLHPWEREEGERGKDSSMQEVCTSKVERERESRRDFNHINSNVNHTRHILNHLCCSNKLNTKETHLHRCRWTSTTTARHLHASWRGCEDEHFHFYASPSPNGRHFICDWKTPSSQVKSEKSTDTNTHQNTRQEG